MVGVSAIAAEELDDEDRRAIRESVRELASAAEAVVHAVTTGEVPADSPAYAQARATVNVFGDQYLFTSAHSTIHLTILAAVAHIKTFVAVVGREGTTTPTATLTRGAVEALAKAHFLLSTEDGSQLAQRWVGLQLLEFKHMTRSEFQDGAGNLIDVAEHVDILRQTLRRSGLSPMQPTLTDIVRALLDASASLDVGTSQRLYAELSSIAHANTSAIAMHLRDEGGRGPRLRLPRKIVFEQAGMNVGTLVVVVDRYLQVHHPPTGVRERWEEALARSYAPLRQIQAARGPDS